MRGERDYTQRVLATFIPGSLASGRLVWQENFEGLIQHYSSVSSGLTIVHTPENVYEGDGAASFTCTALQIKEYYIRVPAPTNASIGIEHIWKVSNNYMGNIAIVMDIYDGETHFRAGARLRLSDGKLLVEILDANLTYVTYKTYDITLFAGYWHFLCVRVNIGTGMYELVQFDGVKCPISGQAILTETSIESPNAEYALTFTASEAGSCTFYFDNIRIGYEEV